MTTTTTGFCSNNNCDDHAKCNNGPNNYTCVCEEGYFGTGKSCLKGSCYDNYKCPENQECVSSTGLQCQCSTGFEKQNNKCVDIDECLARTHNCSDKQTCINTDGGFYCQEWILVLNTKKTSNVPMVIDGRGKSREIEFAYGSETQAYKSCSIIWHGEMYLFGGNPQNTSQISVIDECQLTKKGNLPFIMNAGACAQRDNEEIFICFEDISDESTWKNCRRSTGPFGPFSKLTNSNYEHKWTSTAVTSGELVNFLSEFHNFQSFSSLLVAKSRSMPRRRFCHDPTLGRLRLTIHLERCIFQSLVISKSKFTKSFIEIFQPEKNIYKYSVVALESSFLIFGGRSDGDNSNVIASFSTLTKQ